MQLLREEVSLRDELFSRESAAGWDQSINANLRVLVVGTGALGQNCLLPLALAQVGSISMVDFGTWDLSNASRSPMFGSDEERRRFDNLKAPTVAHRLQEMTSWSDKPILSYAACRFEELGDAWVRQFDVIVAAVDSNLVRSNIAQMSLRHGIPMIEGGFSGFTSSYGIYSGKPEDGCSHQVATRQPRF